MLGCLVFRYGDQEEVEDNLEECLKPGGRNIRGQLLRDQGVEQRVVDDLSKHASAGYASEAGENPRGDRTKLGLVDNILDRFSCLLGHEATVGILRFLALVFVVVGNVGVDILNELRFELERSDVRDALWRLEGCHLVQNFVEVLLLLELVRQLLHDIVERERLEAEDVGNVTSHGVGVDSRLVVGWHEGRPITQEHDEQMNHVLNDV